MNFSLISFLLLTHNLKLFQGDNGGPMTIINNEEIILVRSPLFLVYMQSYFLIINNLE